MKAQQVTEHVMDFIAANGVPFRVVYGVRQYRGGGDSTYPVVSFYDRRFPMDAHGQFVSDYMSEDIMSHGAYGLDLYGGENSWKINDGDMQEVKRWLNFTLMRASGH